MNASSNVPVLTSNDVNRSFTDSMIGRESNDVVIGMMTVSLLMHKVVLMQGMFHFFLKHERFLTLITNTVEMLFVIRIVRESIICLRETLMGT